MRTLLLICITFISISCFGQEVVSQDSLTTIDQLSFMKGTWKGEGWIYVNRVKKQFTQTETITPKVDNTLLMIDGLGYDKEEKSKVIHNAFGVISYSKEKQAMTMISFSSTGGKMENQMKLIGDKKIEWSFKNEQGGTIRFREDFSEEGVWLEKGEYSADGKNWFPFFEMRLEKQAE
ncbi:hypothetical protein [Kordia jejudonensis]|uniref:hypothetical protein n=1 Tax=Kordia jejudonensis TaxID=1348245 RepID=UPI00062946B0|nr:hypothetical protein [Kordia jejudonensis]